MQADIWLFMEHLYYVPQTDSTCLNVLS